MTANDVEPRLYPTVIREMIRHENDVTNHRIMWLLIVQGLIANAYVGAGGEQGKGWLQKRIKGWRKRAWICPWLGQTNHLLKPYLFLPFLLILAWLFVLLQHWLNVGTWMLLGLATLLVVAILSLLCVLWVRSQEKGED